MSGWCSAAAPQSASRRSTPACSPTDGETRTSPEFEQLPEKEALKARPELTEAFETLHKAEQYFKAKMPGNASRQETALKAVKPQGAREAKKISARAVRGGNRALSIAGGERNGQARFCPSLSL
jgi:hypothetical protein